MSVAHHLNLLLHPGIFAVSRLSSKEPIPSWALKGSFVSVTRANDELSIVGEQTLVPANVKSERGWKCIYIDGQIPFTTTGVLASLADPLAAAGIGIFAVSTFDTDYILVKQKDLDGAIVALEQAGHKVRSGTEWTIV